MKKENIGKRCILKALKTIVKTWHGAPPYEDDFLIFVIVKIYHGGYYIEDFRGNIFKVKTNDIILIK